MSNCPRTEPTRLLRPASRASNRHRRRELADGQLVAEFVAGDQHAFDEIVRRYELRLSRIACRIVGNPGDASDVVQDSFIRAWRGLGRFRGEATLATWLHRIVVNTARSHLQRNRRYLAWSQFGPTDEELPPACLPIDIDTPDQLLLRDDLEARLNAALSELPDRLRRPILLREYQGLRYAVIAELLEIPLGTVRSRIFRARRHIEARIQPLIAN